MARDLAESPSVMMRVQPREFLPPASLASSSLAMPRSFECLEPLCFLDIWAWDFARAQLSTRSMTPQLVALIKREREREREREGGRERKGASKRREREEKIIDISPGLNYT